MNYFKFVLFCKQNTEFLCKHLKDCFKIRYSLLFQNLFLNSSNFSFLFDSTFVFCCRRIAPLPALWPLCRSTKSQSIWRNPFFYLKAKVFGETLFLSESQSIWRNPFLSESQSIWRNLFFI